ncbi:MAG: trifunctional dihydropteroate synthetase [Geoglossum simile]|nr:MAG: trifunctional dihydropteroate synthetase [Geoglossum simile]
MSLRGLSSFPARTPPLRQEQDNRNPKERIVLEDFKIPSTGGDLAPKSNSLSPNTQYNIGRIIDQSQSYENLGKAASQSRPSVAVRRFGRTVVDHKFQETQAQIKPLREYRNRHNHTLADVAVRIHNSNAFVEASATSAEATRRGAMHGSADPPLQARPREKHQAFIALGSNLGDRIGMIQQACVEMDRRGIRVIRTSGLWETEPMYVREQPRFVNGACEVETTLTPMQLLDQLQDIENSLGRRKFVEKGPRNIDLDILLYDDLVMHEERLSIPHKLMLEREFVLRPLCELIPHKRLPSPHARAPLLSHLNALPPPTTPLSALTPLSSSLPPLATSSLARPTMVMAILNLTPDSFSDGGLHSNEPANIVNTVFDFISSGASVIDIGGQSTRPGSYNVGEREELARVIPAIVAIRSSPLVRDVCISVDTYRASVAEAACAAGADIINDVSAGRIDPNMLPTLARLGVTVCLMHSRGTPINMSSLTDYPGGIIPSVAAELLDRVRAAEAAGIRRWRMILDPGIGFAKTTAQSLEILRHLSTLRDFEGLRGLPWLVGASRKGFIGKVTGVAKPEERTWGTAVAMAACVAGGVDIVRVHDVAAMTKVTKMADAVWKV